jgi:hypothetical protein
LPENLCAIAKDSAGLVGQWLSALAGLFGMCVPVAASVAGTLISSFPETLGCGKFAIFI